MYEESKFQGQNIDMISYSTYKYDMPWDKQQFDELPAFDNDMPDE